MDDLKSVTVEYLRGLARKHLGRGHTRFKTKAQLLGALAVFVPALAVLAKAVGAKRKNAKAQAAKQSAVDGRESAVPEEKKSKKAEPKVKPAQVVNFPPKPKAPVRPPAEPEAVTHTAAPLPTEAPAEPLPPAPPPAQHLAEPLVEGFFVARVAGEGEAQRHHLTGPGGRASGSPAGYDENLGELPLDYGDDLALALPRDPHTLFVTWDFNTATRERALDGLEAPRAVLRVFDGEKLVREADFALESRSFYLHGLPAGRPYRVEAHFVARDGRSRRIGHSTNRVTLPPEGPSSDTSVRYMRVAPRTQAPSTEPSRAPAPEEREYITWRRVALPGSAGFEDIPETRRERIGSSEERYLEAHRPPGASEQRYLQVERAPGASDQRYIDVPRAPGASEQRYIEVQRAQGSSEQTSWTPPPSGRGQQ